MLERSIWKIVSFVKTCIAFFNKRFNIWHLIPRYLRRSFREASLIPPPQLHETLAAGAAKLNSHAGEAVKVFAFPAWRWGEAAIFYAIPHQVGLGASYAA